jgi:hypothetical protein
MDFIPQKLYQCIVDSVMSNLGNNSRSKSDNKEVYSAS